MWLKYWKTRQVHEGEYYDCKSGHNVCNKKINACKSINYAKRLLQEVEVMIKLYIEQ